MLTSVDISFDNVSSFFERFKLNVDHVFQIASLRLMFVSFHSVSSSNPHILYGHFAVDKVKNLALF